MAKKYRLAIFTSSILKTSTGSMGTVLSILSSLNPEKYSVSIILIDNLLDKSSAISQSEIEKDPAYISVDQVMKHPLISNKYYLEEMTIEALKNNFDGAIVAIYNTYGEDGRLLGLLDLVGLPYMSPGVKTSSLCFDKDLTKKVLSASRVPVSPGFVFHKNDNLSPASISEKIISECGEYPVMFKSSESGASRGMSLVNDESEIVSALESALRFSDEIVVEKYIKGREFTVGVIGNFLNPKALPVVEIVTENKFFDYEAKYVAGKAQEICPAKIEESISKQLQTIAISAYVAVKAKSHSRVDMMLSENGKIYVLEINTFPGLMPASLFPKELVADGSSLGEFVDNFANSSWK